jgi:hypothetical protein
VVLLFWSGMTMSIPTILAGLCFAATVIWGYDAYATARQTMRDALRAEKREQSETGTPINGAAVNSAAQIAASSSTSSAT